MQVEEPRKRRRDRNLTAGRRQKPKWKTQASWEYRRRLTVAGKKMTRRATVVWRRKNAVRRIWTHENCGQRKEFAVVGIRTTQCAKVARGREHGLQKQGKDDIAPRTRKGRTQENKCFKGPECKNGVRYRCLRQQLQGKNGIKDRDTRRQLRLRIEKTSNDIFRGKIAKQVVINSSGLRKIRKWTLWRGRPPPKRKKRSCTE
jgi:hypothetical protein